MTGSNLVVHTRISPTSHMRTTGRIDAIVLHHMGSTALSIEACGAEFARKERKASAHYGVGSDGRIGQYVDEARRACTSSNWKVDDHAITIEVANDTRDPDWHVSDAALAATIDLIEDICRRNPGIGRINYTGDLSGNLIMHKWLAYTGCPGPYLGSKFSYIAEEVNRRLAGQATPAEPEKTPETPEADTGDTPAMLAVGDVIELQPATRYTTGKLVPDWVCNRTLYCRAIVGENITFSVYPEGSITGTTSVRNVRLLGQKVESSGKQPQADTSVVVGEKVRLRSGARYITGKLVPDWVVKRTCYIRRIYSNGNIDFSILSVGPITGTVTADALERLG